MHKIATLIVLLGLTAQPAFALKIDTGVDVSAEAGTEEGVYTTLESNATVTTETNAGANVESENGIAVGPITITASDVDETQVTITSTAEVDSEADLDSYARGVVKTHADVRDVVLSETEVAVSHKQKARLFGILPITVYARTQVTSDGTVETKFPWYAFASAKKASIESRVATAVHTSLPTVTAEANASAKFSAQTQAEILEKTVAAMQAEAAADAAAQVSAQ
jgi:hypothetical protein